MAQQSGGNARCSIDRGLALDEQRMPLFVHGVRGHIHAMARTTYLSYSAHNIAHQMPQQVHRGRWNSPTRSTAKSFIVKLVSVVIQTLC